MWGCRTSVWCGCVDVGGVILVWVFCQCLGAVVVCVYGCGVSVGGVWCGYVWCGCEWRGGCVGVSGYVGECMGVSMDVDMGVVEMWVWVL